MFFIAEVEVTCNFDDVYTKNKITLHGPNVDITTKDYEGKTNIIYNEEFFKSQTFISGCKLQVSQIVIGHDWLIK